MGNGLHCLQIKIAMRGTFPKEFDSKLCHLEFPPDFKIQSSQKYGRARLIYLPKYWEECKI